MTSRRSTPGHSTPTFGRKRLLPLRRPRRRPRGAQQPIDPKAHRSLNPSAPWWPPLRAPRPWFHRRRVLFRYLRLRWPRLRPRSRRRSEEHTSELQSLTNLVCRLLLEKKKRKTITLRLTE